MKKRIFSAIVIGISLVAAGLLAGKVSNAVDMHETRGRISLDLKDNTVQVDSTSPSDSGFTTGENESEYLLYFNNDFTDRNNIGVTYRFKDRYEMTDVEEIEFYGYSSNNYNHKFLYYVDSDSKKFYHKNDFDDVKTSMLNGSGAVWGTHDIDDKKYHRKSVKINPRYGEQYVFFGLSHAWYYSDANVYLDNESIGDNQGCMNLKLKEHKITLLEPNEVKQMVADENGNVTEKYCKPFTDVRLCLEDGEKYYVGETGSVYRDETVTLQYTLADNSGCRLAGFKFYEDADKKEMIYRYEAEGQDASTSSFTFDAKMIQEIEDVIGDYKLEDIYISPYFTTDMATSDVSSVVVESDDLVVGFNWYDSEGRKYYSIREKDRYYDQEGILGSFTVSSISRTGDDIVVDYTPNASYQGPFSFRYFEYRICENENQVDGTSYNTAKYSEDKPDLVTTVTDQYFWLRTHVSLGATITLADKTVTYSNEQIKMSEAKVTGTAGYPQPTGKVTYQYYKDADCTDEIDVEKDGYPINAGTYYVIATLGQDDYYDKVVSEPATLTIEKAVPVLKGLRGSDIIYGENTVKDSTPSGVACGVTGGELPSVGGSQGTFEWKSETGSNPAPGTAKETVVFTPNELSSENYTTAEGDATIRVLQATPTITMNGVEKTYDGEPVTLSANVTGVNGEKTGQEISYEYYKDKNCILKLSDEPVDAGTYYATAYVRANSNYSYAEMEDPVTVKINQKESSLIQVPLTNQTYRVYVTNTVPGHAPQGKLTLTILVGGEEKGSKKGISITEDEKGICYAQCEYQDIKSLVGDATEFVVRAEYSEASGRDITENYKISSNELTLESTEPGSIAMHKELDFTYGGSSQTVNVAEVREIQEANVTGLTVKRSNIEKVNQGDVVEVSQAGTSYSIKPKNAGTATLALYVEGTVSETETRSWYLFYDCTVNPTGVSVTLEEKTVVYSGNAVTADSAKVTVKDAGETKDISDNVQIIYSYYRDADCTDEIKVEEDGYPINVGTYYVKAQTRQQRNYAVGEGTGSITITPAEPTILISDKTVTYNGEGQGLDTPIVTGVDGTAAEITDAARKPAGTVTLLYDGEEKLPVNAGEYTVTAVYEPGEKDNYSQSDKNQPSATLTIARATCTITLAPEEMVYTGNYPKPNKVTFAGVNGETKDTTKKYTYMYSLSTKNEYSEERPTDAGLYYVYAIREAGGNYEEAISDRSTLLIERAELTIALDDITTDYDGTQVDPKYMHDIEPTTITNQNGDVLNGEALWSARYYYFSDENATKCITNPKNAGIYYIQAYVSGTRNYTAATSNVAKHTINKVMPVLVPGPDYDRVTITYGQSVEEAKISCIAFGVKGENEPLNAKGTYVWDSTVKDLKPEVGGDSYDFRFIPGSSIAVNYMEAGGDEPVTVTPATPVITGEDQTVTYNGTVISSKEAEVTGVEGMKEPTGTITYNYYTDEKCENLVGTEGVKEVGTYYCKAIFTASTEKPANYTNAESEPYQIKVEKADAIIDLQVPGLGKNLEQGTVTVKGNLIGLFDAPTGTVSLWQKDSDASDDAYKKVIESIDIKQGEDGSYGFRQDISVEKGIYDFKAIYNNDGSKQNYNIADGVEEDVDMSKEPQHITFETKQIQKVYGDDDWKVEVVETEAPGTGKIRYSVVERLGDSDAITVAEDGTIQIKDTGTAFVKAVKEGDETYRAAYAIAAIQINPAPVTLSLSDKKVTYTGNPVGIGDAVVMSNDKIVAEEENIPVTYTYTYKQDGVTVILDRKPVQAAEYEVSASSGSTDHYLASESPASAKFTIEKANARIGLKVTNINEVEKKLTLDGVLFPVFDDPSGTITLYQKLSSEPEEAYKEVAKGIDLVSETNDAYSFQTTVDIELNQTYDFKAVYAEGKVKNYTIQDGVLSNVDVIETLYVDLADAVTIYSGDPVNRATLENPARVTNRAGENITDEVKDGIWYQYYADQEGKQKIDQPTDAGIYYVQAVVSYFNNHTSCSEVKKLTIEKAVPTISSGNAAPITYGQAVKNSEITAVATGVKGESLDGKFVWDSAIAEEKLDAGTYTRKFSFVPDSLAQKNYTEAEGTVTLKVNPATPTVVGEEQTYTYSGKMISSKAATVTGVEEMAIPKGTITYRYYTDENCTQLLDAKGVTDAGTYYCKAIFIASTDKPANYTDAESEPYQIVVEKADATIDLQVASIDKKQGTATIKGNLVGVFDNPSGTMTLYQKLAGESEDAYREAAKQVEITLDDNGIYSFQVDVDIQMNQTYDFKAVYEEGKIQNYTIADGTLTNVDIQEDGDDKDNDPGDSGDMDSNDKNSDAKDAKEQNRGVDTGDHTMILFWLLLMSASVAVIIRAKKKIKR